MRREAKNSRQHFVYLQAAVLASMADVRCRAREGVASISLESRPCLDPPFTVTLYSLPGLRLALGPDDVGDVRKLALVGLLKFASSEPT